MKISVDVECTAEEARAFFGMPEVRALQARVLKEVEARMRAGLQEMDPEALLKMWMPGGDKAWEQFRGFWEQFGSGKK